MTGLNQGTWDKLHQIHPCMTAGLVKFRCVPIKGNCRIERQLGLDLSECRNCTAFMPGWYMNSNSKPALQGAEAWKVSTTPLAVARDMQQR